MSGPGDKIRIRYDEIEDVSRHFDTLSDDASARVYTLRQQLDVLESGAWIGAGAERFYDEMHFVVLPALQRLVDAFQASSAVLLVASEQFRDADARTGRLFAEFQIEAPSASGPFGVLERILGITSGRYTLGDAIGFINNALGIARELKPVPSAVANVLKLVEAGYGSQNLGQLLEQLAEGGTQIIVERGIGLVPSIVNDAHQIVGKVAAGFSAFINGFSPDPQLAEAISRFDVMLENADSSSVTGSFSTVVVDLGQLNLEGYSRHPALSRLLSIGGPLVPALVGVFSNPALTSELQHDSLTFVGSVVDFGAGVIGMSDAYVDLTANTARVVTHSVGEFAGFPPAFNERLSAFVGEASETLGRASFGPVGQASGAIGEVLDAFGIRTSGAPDFSTWLGNLVPN